MNDFCALEEGYVAFAEEESHESIQICENERFVEEMSFLGYLVGIHDFT
jgi:hypothetical protein